MNTKLREGSLLDAGVEPQPQRAGIRRASLANPRHQDDTSHEG